MKLHNILLRHAAKLATSQTVRRVEIYAEIGRRQAHPMTEMDLREIEAMEAEGDNCRRCAASASIGQTRN
jgi:hypothetical protein